MTEVKPSEISNFSPSAFEKTKRRNKLMIRFDCCRVPASGLIKIFDIHFQSYWVKTYIWVHMCLQCSGLTVAARLSNCCHTMEMEHFRTKKFSWVFCQQNYGDRRLRGKKMLNFVFKGYNVFNAVIYNICFILFPFCFLNKSRAGFSYHPYLMF